MIRAVSVSIRNPMVEHHPQGYVRFFRDPILRQIFPELRLCRNDVERERVKKLAQGAWLQQLAFAAVGIGLFILLDRAVNLRSLLPGWIPHLLRGIITLVTQLVCLGVLIYGGMYLFREPARKKIRVYLRAQGLLICEDCGYDIRGLVDAPEPMDRCPECGQPLIPAKN